MHQHNYIRGMRQGIPVGLGYFVVSFTIGIAARKASLTAAQATVMSLTNLTSAGQFASFALIASGAPCLEMVLSQAVINLRYCLMSCALSQKLDSRLAFHHRLFSGHGSHGRDIRALHCPERETESLVHLWGHECGHTGVDSGNPGGGAVHRGPAPDIFKCHEYGAVRHVHRDLYARGQGG